MNSEMKDFMSEEDIESYFVKDSSLAKSLGEDRSQNRFYKWIKKVIHLS